PARDGVHDAAPFVVRRARATTESRKEGAWHAALYAHLWSLAQTCFQDRATSFGGANSVSDPKWPSCYGMSRLWPKTGRRVRLCAIVRVSWRCHFDIAMSYVPIYIWSPCVRVFPWERILGIFLR